MIKTDVIIHEARQFVVATAIFVKNVTGRIDYTIAMNTTIKRLYMTSKMFQRNILQTILYNMQVYAIFEYILQTLVNNAFIIKFYALFDHLNNPTTYCVIIL